MLRLSDIPFVGEAVNRVSKAAVDAGSRGLRYLFCANNLVNDLDSEIEKVEILEVDVTRKVAEAKNAGKTIENHVVVWQEKTVNIKTQAEQLSRKSTFCTCFKVLSFPNPVYRFQLGRKAAHLAKTVNQHTDIGKDFLAQEIAHLPPIQNIPNSNTSYQSFASRQKAYTKLWDALIKENSDPILGIYGMPGVGKTRMIEEAWKNAMEEKIFDKSARVNVGGERFDVISLQDKLAASLGFAFESNDEKRRASQLKSSLKNGGKTLVVLDDVWEVIPLNDVGIPFGDGNSKGSKILLTSRKKNICLRNKCTDPIEITMLTDDESWEMFRKTVDTTQVCEKIAMEVCVRSGGLPLLIDALGKALEFKSEDQWKDALSQLRNCKFEDIDGMKSEVYNCINFSFEQLGDGEKACLLLCSFFPEDADIEIKMLFDLATGSELLDTTRNMGGVVDTLKSSSLLLQGKDIDTVKVHDVIRSVARSIGEKDYAFLSRRGRPWLPENVDYWTRRLLHLDLDKENVSFSDDLVCPKLHTLWMQRNYRLYQSQQLSNGFFNGFKNLKVLLLQGNFEPQLSIHTLNKLKVLILDGCQISQSFISSLSIDLETLCIWKCDPPSPLHLPELKKLRKLELLSWNSIEVVPNGISKLFSLEELNVPKGFYHRDDADGTFIYAELSQLRCLRNLVIRLDSSYYYPKYDIFRGLVEFNIIVGHYTRLWNSKYRFAIKLREQHMKNGWMALVERAKVVDLVGVKGLQNGFNVRNTSEAFANLRELHISYCKDMEYVASWDGRNRGSSFSNLTHLSIVDSKLKYVFSSSVVKCLGQLQILMIRNCNEIEEIVRVHDSSDRGEDIICFPKLQQLILAALPSLRTFYNNNKVLFPNLVTFYITNLKSNLREEIELGRDEHSFSKLMNLVVSYTDSQHQLLPSRWKRQLQNLETLALRNCWWPGQSLLNGHLTFKRLQDLTVNSCGVSTIFTTSISRNLQQLRYLRVFNCPLLEEIVEDDIDDETPGMSENTISLLMLKVIVLESLLRLRTFSSSLKFTFNMQSLEDVTVNDCPCMDKFTSLQIVTPLLEEDLNSFIRREKGTEKIIKSAGPRR